MKRIVLALWLCMLTLGMMGVPAKRGIWQTIRLKDGTTVRVMLCGDERMHFWRSAEGVRYVEDEDTPNFYKVLNEEVFRKNLSARNKRFLSVRKARRRVIQNTQPTTVYTGKKKGLIILVQFNDSTFKKDHDKNYYNKVANGENFTSAEGFRGSISDYFKAQSGGLFELNFDVVGPVKLPNPASYYGGNGRTGQDLRPGTMVAQACQAVQDSVDFAQYDWDGDGEVDQVLVIYAGMGEADGGASASIWPHEWALSASEYGTTLKIDNVIVDTYACGNEMQVGGVVNGIGTICHEFSHCLGFPDTYDIGYKGNYGMGSWDLMCAGNYNGNTFCPAGYTAYEKMICGWLTPEELTTDKEIRELRPLSEGGGAYIIYNDSNRNEYYLLANRQQTKWDARLAASGLLITHVDYDENCWNNNVVNTLGSFRQSDGYSDDFANDHQRLTIFHADNDDDSAYWDGDLMQYTRMTEAGDTYPYRDNDSLTNNSIPKAILYNANKSKSLLMNKAVKGITQFDDGTIGFNFYVVPESNLNADSIVKGDTVFYESFDQCAGSGGNDRKWNGRIASGEFSPDNQGWEGKYEYGADRCARFGTVKVDGVVTTPSFNVVGTAILTFKIAAWNGANDGTTVDLRVTDGFSIAPSVLKINKGSWTECTAIITGTGNVRVTFMPKKRFFLDEVLVRKSGTTDIRHVDREQTAIREVRIYNIQGQYLGSNLDALPKGLYIVNGKKVVK
ncbi:M6 family metalloprotease domain-containing protein [Hoylesella oralis]|uniref:M6 family metalloprotease domain-containing protein n=1 Tax=Hoylesella oralis TaxID=28134 RepID=UPI0028E204D3|nr:M6 family metalloprotease domain-containing protein [Hoylesella oralis]